MTPVLVEPNDRPTHTTASQLDAGPEYARLALVLCAAFEQAAKGKGKERHANGLPFEQQPMQVIARAHGIGFITGQAAKKLEEAVGMLARGQPDAAVKEILGAIVYAAGAVIFVQDQKGGAE